MSPASASPAFDLQSHSTHSDGALPPAEVVARAAAAGVELLALSDHDTVAGVAEAIEAGRRFGVDVVPAIELSSLDADHEDLHVLGYGVDVTSAELITRLHAFQADRDSRADRMLDALEGLGFNLDLGPIDTQRASGASVGRPHIAQAVFAHPDNADRLAAEGLRAPVDILTAYLVPGAPAYRGRTTPTVAEAISAIHGAGGVAVWAHPFWDVEDPDAVTRRLDAFRALELDGVETFYPTFSREQTEMLAQAASARGLLRTGSSDFHGPEHPMFSAFLRHELHGLTPELGPLPEFAQRAARQRT